MTNMIEYDLSTVITFNPLVAYPATTLADLLRQWTDLELRNWPVVDDDGRLLGVISEQEIVRSVVELAVACRDGAAVTEQALQGVYARHLVSGPLVTISRWDSRANGLYRLLKNQVHSLPVLEDDRLVGLITTTDYLREFSYGDVAASREPVADHVAEGAETIDCDATLDEAAAVMLTTDVQRLGVVSGPFPLGVVTSEDIRLAKCRLECRRCLPAEFAPAGPTDMRELAAQSPIVRPGSRLSEAAGLMVERQRHAVAVVTQGGRFVGSLSDQEILAAVAHSTTGARRSAAAR